ncbi:YCF48-related protein [Pseudomonas laurylsulfatiphila]|uniref:WD40/YVTN/BNR-like repeat-containing protein n=1 Tax=Pseudomonas laurylsulfatiphila TaxID=2011015 RepID=UPI003D0C593F
MKIFIKATLVLCLGSSVGQALAQDSAALADRLERPSRVSPLAVGSLFTDIQALGPQVLMVGESGRILLRAADGSVTQAQVPVDLLLTAVHFVDARNGWVVGHDGVVLHSNDGGLTWSKQLDGVAIYQLMLARAESEVSRLDSASNAAPDDAGLSRALENANFAVDDIMAGNTNGPSRPLLGVWFKDAHEGWVVGAYGIILHTRDAGQTWQYAAGLDNPDRLHLNAVLGLSDGSLLVAGEGGHLHRSSDGGEHWQRLPPVSNASLYKLLAVKDGRLLALGFGGTLLGSDDQGQRWHVVQVPTRASLYGGGPLADGSLLLTGQGGALLHSRDGRHFELWQAPGKKNAWLGAVEVADKRLLLIGNGGLQTLSLAELKEQRK